MTLILGYLLVGFVLHFLGTAIWKMPVINGWAWELAAIVLWPLTITLVIAKAVTKL